MENLMKPGSSPLILSAQMLRDLSRYLPKRAIPLLLCDESRTNIAIVESPADLPLSTQMFLIQKWN
jgi:hypothetical protein